MAFTIDTSSYNKAAHFPVGHGYGVRAGICSSGVVHSTNNGTPNTSFSSEAKYLYESPNVSAHFLVGKDGRIVQFLDPRKYEAWHAGGKQVDGTWTAQPAFANPASWGIELHKSTPDPFYPDIQLDALGWLIWQLAAQFNIAPHLIETHGQIAIAGPYIRKTDPDDWPHSSFVAWRDALFATDPLKARTIAGPPNTPARFCSVEMADFYAARGGFAHLGYALTNEYYDTSKDCYILLCERVVLKRSKQYGMEFALISEAKSEGWV